MKKILFVMIAVLMSFGMANAQTTVMGSRIFQNMYLGAEAGIVHPSSIQEGTMWDAMGYTFGMELGKNITPNFGLSIEGLANTAFDGNGINYTDLYLNGKVNLMNLFGGYNGKPRLVELSVVPGIGWKHIFGDVEDYNTLAYKTGVQVDFNLGKNKAWQINIKPTIVWNHEKNNGAFGFYWNDANPQVTAGLTYKFGYKCLGNKSHNFVVSPYTVTEEDYNNLMASYENTLNKTPDTVYVEKTVEKVVNVVSVENRIPTAMFITFSIGESELQEKDYDMINYFADNMPIGHRIKVIGSADSETGSESRNLKLAQERANVVANELMEYGFGEIEVETMLDIDEDQISSRSAVIMVLE